MKLEFVSSRVEKHPGTPAATTGGVTVPAIPPGTKMEVVVRLTNDDGSLVAPIAPAGGRPRWTPQVRIEVPLAGIASPLLDVSNVDGQVKWLSAPINPALGTIDWVAKLVGRPGVQCPGTINLSDASKPKRAKKEKPVHPNKKVVSINIEAARGNFDIPGMRAYAINFNDANGAGVPKATIQVFDAGQTMTEYEADELGSLALSLAPGRYMLNVSGPGITEWLTVPAFVNQTPRIIIWVMLLILGIILSVRLFFFTPIGPLLFENEVRQEVPVIQDATQRGWERTFNFLVGQGPHTDDERRYSPNRITLPKKSEKSWLPFFLRFFATGTTWVILIFVITPWAFGRSLSDAFHAFVDTIDEWRQRRQEARGREQQQDATQTRTGEPPARPTPTQPANDQAGSWLWRQMKSGMEHFQWELILDVLPAFIKNLIKRS